jgi:NIPSNAP
MIIEMRTLHLKIAAGPAVEAAYAKALPARVAILPLGGFWHSEVGTLNQVLLMWPL